MVGSGVPVNRAITTPHSANARYSLVGYFSGRVVRAESRTWRALVLSLALSMSFSVKHVFAADDFSWPRSLKLQSLALGNALFEYYRGDELAAMTAVQVADSRKLLAGQQQPAFALLASMQLRYGMYGEAERIFTQVLTTELPADVREYVLAELVQLHYRAGEHDKARQRLLSLPVLTDIDRRERMASIRALLALARNEPASAAQALTEIAPSSSRYRYALFNLGLTQMRLGQVEAARASFNQLQLLPVFTAADKALKDRSALAQAYDYLRAKQWTDATGQFSQVRLSGPYSTKALLGLGWAQAYQGQYALALPAWIELNTRSSFDLSVQEGRLAISYAYQQIGALPSALQQFQNAAQTYEQELDALRSEQAAVESGVWLTRLQALDFNDDQTQYNLDAVPMFHHLLASHRLQSGVKHYQQLAQLQNLLSDWHQRLPVYDEMVSNHEQRFAQLAPGIDSHLQALDLASWGQRLTELRGQMDVAAQSENWSVLANTNERAALTRLDRVDARLATVAQHQAISPAQQDRRRLLRGVVQFNIEQQAIPRRWQMQREWQQAEAAVIELNSHQSRLLAARTVAAQRYSRYQERIEGLRGRLDQLRIDNAAAMAQQGNFINQLLLNEIGNWRTQLAEYRLQAQLSYARLQDAASRESAP